MDPNEALANMRRWIAAVNEAKTRDDLAICAVDLAQAAEALDEWLSGGGFPPDAWSAKRERRYAQLAMDSLARQVSDATRTARRGQQA